jgi:hypothetical protein
MDDSDQPVSGYGLRLQRLREELSRQLAAPAASIAGQGRVRQVQWHDTERHWLYLLADENGNNISKRYLASDLRESRFNRR